MLLSCGGRGSSKGPPTTRAVKRHRKRRHTPSYAAKAVKHSHTPSTTLAAYDSSGCGGDLSKMGEIKAGVKSRTNKLPTSTIRQLRKMTSYERSSISSFTIKVPYKCYYTFNELIWAQS